MLWFLESEKVADVFFLLCSIARLLRGLYFIRASHGVYSIRTSASFEASLPSQKSMERPSDHSLPGTGFQYPDIDFGLSPNAKSADSVPFTPAPTPTPAMASTGPIDFDFASQLSDAEALQSRADWRWFHDHPPPQVSQHVGAGIRTGTGVRHHVPHPLASTPAPTPTLELEQIFGTNWPGPSGGLGAGIGHAISGLRDEPISTRGRAARTPSASTPGIGPAASASAASVAMGARSFLSVASPQSAARDEPGAGAWNLHPQSQSQTPAVRLPQPPYIAFQHQQQQRQQSLPRSQQQMAAHTPPPSFSRGR